MPHTICIEAYEYDELSDSAKETALDNLSQMFDFWGDDHKAVLDAFVEIFPVTVKDWEYGNRCNMSFTLDVYDDIAELSGIRLLKYLWNNYKNDLYKGKYYAKYINGKIVSRHSKIRLDSCCPLTGYYTDDDILAPIFEFMNMPYHYVDFYDLMRDCLWNWVHAGDIEYQSWYSEESLTDMADVNDLYFDKHGNIIRKG